METTNVNNISNKIWLVIDEANIDGEVLVDVYPCLTKEAARRKMDEKIRRYLTSGHFNVSDLVEDGDVENTTLSQLKSLAEDEYGDNGTEDWCFNYEDNSYWEVKDNCDDYWIELKMTEEEVIS